MKIQILPEQRVHGRRLGRHIEHDPASRAFAVALPPLPLRSVAHVTHGPVLDQGDIGRCTAFALVGGLMTEPLYRSTRSYGEKDGDLIYRKATRIDGVPGVYPPDDTGSTGLAVCKVAKALGLIGSYRHAFDVDQALQALMRGPILVGTNWYAGMDQGGILDASGALRGGHEYLVRELDVERERVRMRNSWGEGWSEGGEAWISFVTLRRLLSEDGDVRVPLAA